MAYAKYIKRNSKIKVNFSYEIVINTCYTAVIHQR